MSVETRAIPDVGPGEALVGVRWAGICGSDIDLRNGNRPAEKALYPIVPGHEWSGVVQAIGEGVNPDLLHKPVVGENIRSCGECDACRAGRVANCAGTYREAGFTIDGAWADRLLVPANQLHVLPDHVDLRSAAGLEPAACAATAVHEAHVESHDVVGVVGGGTLGMLCTQFLSSRGVDVIVVDPQAWKATLALQCGATRLIDLEVARTMSGSFDVIIEAAGAPGSAQSALDLVRRGGRVVMCGIATSDDNVNSVDIVSKNLQVVGVFGATKDGWVAAVAAFVEGSIDPGMLVTHEFPLHDFERALSVVENAGPMVGKVLLRP